MLLKVLVIEAPILVSEVLLHVLADLLASVLIVMLSVAVGDELFVFVRLHVRCFLLIVFLLIFLSEMPLENGCWSFLRFRYLRIMFGRFILVKLIAIVVVAHHSDVKHVLILQGLRILRRTWQVSCA